MSKKASIKPKYTTKFGKMYCGESEELLAQYPLTLRKKKVQLIFTSPPFPLNKKKKYGNLVGEEYLNWISSFAPLLTEYLSKNGSIVIEIGNAWEKGKPVMSTLPMEALLAFKKAGKLYLCQEFVCFNPARLPSPAEWVNVERSRVKDAFTKVWWMSKTIRPKANNKKILTEYSESMKQLLSKGTYNSGTRPSDHHIGKKSFLSNNKGAIPPNVLVPSVVDMLPELIDILPISNTSSIDNYRRYCNKSSIKPHPARMPKKLVEFFVKFLTDENDLVMDPFGGSNTTGFVCESLKRRWISIEPNKDYVEASKGHFIS